MSSSDEYPIKSGPGAASCQQSASTARTGPGRPQDGAGQKSQPYFTGPNRRSGERPKLPVPGPGRGGVPERIERTVTQRFDYVDLSGLGLEELPPEALTLPDIPSLVLRDNNFATVPEALRRFPKLRSVDLGHNRLTELPSWLFEIPGLVTLNMDGNQIAELPISLSPSAPLRSLDLSSNLIETLKPLVELKHLRHLFLAGNKRLKALPAWMAPLESLDLSDTDLERLPNLSYLRSLKDLAVSNNPILELPGWLGELTLLERLFACLTSITSLPEAMRALQQLTFLELSGTHLQQLPDWIVELRSLQHLHISSCGLTSLPEDIGRLANLRTLSAANATGVVYRLGPERHRHAREVQDPFALPNDLQGLPSTLRDLARLERLDLHGNERLGIPDEVLGPVMTNVAGNGVTVAHPSAILGYYFRLKRGVTPLNEAKLILVGRGGTGKTSIVNRVIHNRFQLGEAKTDGIEITPWSFRVPPTDDVRLHVWDFGGQEMMHATHQFFLTHRSLYLLVLSGRGGGEDADAEYWLKLIQSRGTDASGDGSPVIVVLNKCDQLPFQMDRRGLRAKYPCIKGFVETDCETQRGIADLRELIRTETGLLRHLRDPFPASWFAIKDRLARMQENYLTYEHFREICRENGEPDEVAQDQLATYLNSLGIALNYRDDPRLRDMHILNPHWVTEGIYTILNSSLVAQQGGVLHLGQVSEILDPRQFPPHMHQFLVNLMRKFELCFPFPDDDATYLVPELLGKEQPNLDAFDFSGTLSFQYDYTVIPEGLLPRFIVRTHALSRALPRWRTGVVLEFEGQRASVVADVQDRKVRIAVAGPAAGRRRLLAVIRSNFDHIHSSIEKLKPVEMVPIPGHCNAMVPFEELVAFEREGERELRKLVDGKIARLEVRSLLEGVDIEPVAPGRQRRMDASAVEVFISYSHKDESLRNELQAHLMLLQRVGLVSAWSDRCIKAGEEWQRSIDERIGSADVVILLVSADFITSDYCYGQELSRAMARHEAGQARVIPVIVRDVAWKKAPFGELQALPRDGQSVTAAGNRDIAWRQVSEDIEAVIKEVLAERGRSS